MCTYVYNFNLILLCVPMIIAFDCTKYYVIFTKIIFIVVLNDLLSNCNHLYKHFKSRGQDFNWTLLSNVILINYLLFLICGGDDWYFTFFPFTKKVRGCPILNPSTLGKWGAIFSIFFLLNNFKWTFNLFFVC